MIRDDELATVGLELEGEPWSITRAQNVPTTEGAAKLVEKIEGRSKLPDLVERV